jgi:hypothetical protein
VPWINGSWDDERSCNVALKFDRNYYLDGAQCDPSVDCEGLKSVAIRIAIGRSRGPESFDFVPDDVRPKDVPSAMSEFLQTANAQLLPNFGEDRTEESADLVPILLGRKIYFARFGHPEMGDSVYPGYNMTLYELRGGTQPVPVAIAEVGERTGAVRSISVTEGP